MVTRGAKTIHFTEVGDKVEEELLVIGLQYCGSTPGEFELTELDTGVPWANLQIIPTEPSIYRSFGIGLSLKGCVVTKITSGEACLYHV